MGEDGGSAGVQKLGIHERLFEYTFKTPSFKREFYFGIVMLNLSS